MPASHCARTRSNSPLSKVGRRATSANRSSDGASLSFSADSEIDTLSRPAPAPISAPSASLRAASASAPYWPAPSSSIAVVKLAVPSFLPMSAL